MVDTPIKTNSTHFEYVYIAGQRCECGGRYAFLKQSLLTGPPPIDRLDCRCRQCGRERAFDFDIGSFFGQIDKYGRFEETDRAFHEALAHLKAGELVDAEQGFLRVIDPDEGEPNFGIALFYLGGLYLKLNQPDRAYEYLARAANIQPLEPAYHQLLAFACQSTGRPEEARRHLTTMLELGKRLGPIEEHG